jgi:hypothetical protein
MSVVDFEKGNGHRPGTWRMGRAFGREIAFFVCPRCGAEDTLREHRVQPGGYVTPDVVCDSDGCQFHAEVRLVGWPIEAST